MVESLRLYDDGEPVVGMYVKYVSLLLFALYMWYNEKVTMFYAYIVRLNSFKIVHV